MPVRFKSGFISRVIVAKLPPNSNLLFEVKKLCIDNNISSGLIFAIGTLSSVKLGFYVGKGEYKEIPINKFIELLSLVGNISRKSDGELVVHAHVSIGDEDGKAFGGHLIDAVVGSTVEVTILDCSEMDLRREYDPETGLYTLIP